MDQPVDLYLEEAEAAAEMGHFDDDWLASAPSTPQDIQPMVKRRRLHHKSGPQHPGWRELDARQGRELDARQEGTSAGPPSPPLAEQVPAAASVHRAHSSVDALPTSAAAKPLGSGKPAELHAAADDPQQVLPWTSEAVKQFEALGPTDGRRKYFLVFRHLRSWIDLTSRCIASTTSDQGELLMLRAYRDWKRLGKPLQNQIVHQYISVIQPPAQIVEYMVEQWGGSKAREGVRLKTSGVLLTYIGEWGVIPPEQFQHKFSPGSSVDDLCSWLQLHTSVKSLWADLQANVQKCVTDLRLDSWSVCLEVCTQSWAEGVLRLHGHAFMKLNHGRFYMPHKDYLSFRGAEAHRSLSVFGQQARASIGFAGHYYVTAPKVGQVCHASNVKAFVDYQVAPFWVWNLVSAGKMSPHNAQGEFVRLGRGVQRNLADLQTMVQARQNLRVHAHAEAVREAHRRNQFVFRTFTKVDEWLKKYSQGVWPRKPFLVLVGRSGLGKTEFVRGLFPRDSLLELNCSGIAAIHLTGFDPEVTRGILWDELPAQVLLANRKLFQHPPVWVDLGHSPTAAHIKKYWLNDCLSVVASNTWMHELDEMRSVDRDWLMANSVLLEVHEPMWVAQKERETVADESLTPISRALTFL